VAVAISEGPAPLRRPIWYQKHMARHMQDEMLGQWLDRLGHALDDRLRSCSNAETQPTAT